MSLKNFRERMVEDIELLHDLDLQILLELCVVLQGGPTQKLAHLRIVQTRHPQSENLRLKYLALQI